MMIAQPRQQAQQPPLPGPAEPRVRSNTTTTRGRSMTSRRRIPPFLVVSAASSSSSSSEGHAEDVDRNDEDPQQRPKSRQQRRRRSNRNHSRSQQDGGQVASPPSPTTRIFRRLSHSLIRRRQRHQNRRSSHRGSRRSSSRVGPATTASDEPNVVDFLETSCPREVVPLVLAYAGPQVAQALSQSNRFWNDLMKDDATWKVQCQELYKWNSEDEEPASWKDLYASSPCVPVDYPTIDRALAAVPHPTTLWVRPGCQCVLQRPIIVTSDMTIRVMSLPIVPRYDRRHSRSAAAPSKRLLADPADGADDTWRSSDDSGDEDEWPGPTRRDVPEQAVSRSGGRPATNAASRTRRTAEVEGDAMLPCTLVLHTRQMNAPVIWVQSGCLTLDRVVLSHACLGVDIWNGNAALQVQPPAAPPASAGAQRNSAATPTTPPPRAFLTNCQVTSQSGRGVVVMDGGRVLIRQSCVAHCAATGVYIGGPHSPVAGADETTAATSSSERRRSRADLLDSIVTGNGIGSYYRDALAAATAAGSGGARGLLRGHRLPRRPSVIARGHSGVYLEQGDCHISSSVIRSNALTGISAVSDQARLVVTGSTLDSNGSQQLETVPSRFVRLENNRIVDHPHFRRHAPPLHRPGPPLPWVPNQRQDAEDMDEFVRMVMDQP